MCSVKFPVFLFLLIVFAATNLWGQKKSAPKINVTSIDGKLTVKFAPRNKNQTAIHFFRCGINQIYAIGQVDFFDSVSTGENAKPSFEFQSGTDWIGPYFVCLSENAEKGLAQRFTGGWHGSNGDGTGLPTAQTINVKIAANGKFINSDFKGLFDSVQVEVVNHIQGFDDSTFSRPILEETVKYTITPDAKIHVKVNITATENITIQRYYGMQSVNFAVYDSVTYASPQKELNTEPVKANSSCSSNDNTNTILLKDISEKHLLKLVMENTGLGNFEYLAQEFPRAFSASYGKSYFNLDHGKDLVLKQGNSVFWEGCYQFY